MSSTIHDIFLRKVLHLNQDAFTRYVENKDSLFQIIQNFISSSRSLGSGVIVLTRNEQLLQHNVLQDGTIFISVEEAATHILSSEGTITEANFTEFFGKFLQPMLDTYGTVRIYSEMKDYLWDRGHSIATATMEEIWRRTTQNKAILLLSAYHVKNLNDERRGLVFHCINNGHSQFLTKELLLEINHKDFTLSVPANSDSLSHIGIPTIMDVLNAEICHEARNPLTIIKTSSELIRDLFQEGELTAENLEAKLRLIEKSVERIDHILSLFGKRS